MRYKQKEGVQLYQLFAFRIIQHFMWSIKALLFDPFGDLKQMGWFWRHNVYRGSLCSVNVGTIHNSGNTLTQEWGLSHHRRIVLFSAWRGYLIFLNDIKGPLSLRIAWNLKAVEKLWKHISELKSAISHERWGRAIRDPLFWNDHILKHLSQKFESI